jgi:hypothetical protein
MGLIIPNGSSQYLTLRVSVPNTATAANFKFTVINVVAASAVTGQTLPFSSSSYVSGNTMTISPIPTTVVTPRVGQIIQQFFIQFKTSLPLILGVSLSHKF